jgi:hypothetical protein
MIPVEVTRLVPVTETDERGNQRVVRYREQEIEAIHVGQVIQREMTGDQLTVVTQARAIFPADTEIDNDDQLIALGQTWRVTGVLHIPDPKDPTVESHVSADLERSE